MDPTTAPEAGVLLDTNGLRLITEATGITQSGGEQTVLGGPFTESGEVVGGRLTRPSKRCCAAACADADRAVPGASP
ncbi:hypothetical protein ACW9HR_02520 [Nocardia gipuzkoensis]